VNPFNPVTNRLLHDERSGPSEELTNVCQPLTIVPAADPLSGLRSALAFEKGTWGQFLSPEQTAWCISQLTAAHLLPPLTRLPCGSDLLTYQVWLRDRLGPFLVDELDQVLAENWRQMGWEHVAAHSYMCVIGAGVAARIDATPGDEQLCLRYESALANELFHAGRAVDLPRSRLFLQQTLFEQVDALLTLVRARLWCWLDT
jgi:hypothetical protein